MYEAQLEKDWRYIVIDSEAKMIIAASDKIYDVVEEYIGKVRMCVRHVSQYVSLFIRMTVSHVYLYTYTYPCLHFYPYLNFYGGTR